MQRCVDLTTTSIDSRIRGTNVGDLGPIWWCHVCGDHNNASIIWCTRCNHGKCQKLCLHRRERLPRAGAGGGGNDSQPRAAAAAAATAADGAAAAHTASAEETAPRMSEGDTLRETFIKRLQHAYGRSGDDGQDEVSDRQRPPRDGGASPGWVWGRQRPRRSGGSSSWSSSSERDWLLGPAEQQECLRAEEPAALRRWKSGVLARVRMDLARHMADNARSKNWPEPQAYSLDLEAPKNRWGGSITFISWLIILFLGGFNAGAWTAAYMTRYR